MRTVGFLVCILSALFPVLALAGPPYVTDDPEPTDYQHHEIYAFTAGTETRDGTVGAAGIDFNYGGAPDLQLTMVMPIEYDSPGQGPSVAGLGNVELAAKYRFLHQDDFGWDVAVFPRIFLPSASPLVGDKHASFLLPVWVGREFGKWSTFGGGGCALNNGGGSQDYCQVGWVLTRQVLPALNIGAEIYHRTADTRGGKAGTGIDVGATYDLSDNYHLMATFGPGIQNAAETNRYSWYTAILFTF
jgi:hypothetical protein